MPSVEQLERLAMTQNTVEELFHLQIHLNLHFYSMQSAKRCDVCQVLNCDDDVRLWHKYSPRTVSKTDALIRFWLRHESLFWHCGWPWEEQTTPSPWSLQESCHGIRKLPPRPEEAQRADEMTMRMKWHFSPVSPCDSTAGCFSGSFGLLRSFYEFLRLDRWLFVGRPNLFFEFLRLVRWLFVFLCSFCNAVRKDMRCLLHAVLKLHK